MFREMRRKRQALSKEACEQTVYVDMVKQKKQNAAK